MLTEKTLVAELRRHHLFSRLPDAALQEVCASANLKRLPAGASLFHPVSYTHLRAHEADS